MAKFVVITGGVVSGLGKGITAGSLGRLLADRGLSVFALKLDPYINVDPGTMSPLQHGEVFVTQDGAETDLDLGHYERFMDVSLGRVANVTSGCVYQTVIERERRGDFLGATVQVIPHVTGEIKARIQAAADESGADVVIVEVGGTVGDIESLPFLEAIREFRAERGRADVMNIHVTLVPELRASGELKTKPTQHSVKELRAIGIQPDAIVCRTERPLPRELKEKIALLCDIDQAAVIENVDAESTYEVPLLLEAQGLGDLVTERLGLGRRMPDHGAWEAMLERRRSPVRSLEVAIVGKYVALHDAYMSVVEALHHAATAERARLAIRWVNSEEVVPGREEELMGGSAGIVVPGGFGPRGVEGKILASAYARRTKTPYFGLCLGMQCAVIDVARSIGLGGANSTEFDPATPHPVITLMDDQRRITDKGGTMRLGRYPTHIVPGTLAHRAYGVDFVPDERHRHRFEFNYLYRERLAGAGLIASGLSPDGRLVEIVELRDHPWFLGTQFHPEFLSRPTRPHPLFASFLRAALARAEGMAAGMAGEAVRAAG
ncbi:MAG: CTP synthase [Firmicutes bacterium]|nr:CTP synthase [Bacillota bacterium]